MTIFKKFFSKIEEKFEEEDIIYLYIKCDRCGENIKVRITKSTDLLYNYNEPIGEVKYTLRKEILGSKCPNLIYAFAKFDKNKNMLNLDVKGGTSITQEEYENR
jgi:hypothetical protein